MNYEELIETQDVRKTNRLRLPYGYFYKRLIDGKYSNFVEFHDELADSIAFNSCIRRACDTLSDIHDKHQLHFVTNDGGGGVYALAVEPGNFISFEHLLNDSPSIVARKDFIDSTLKDLFTITSELHEHEIYHVCFAPSSILVRKNDSTVRLLCHDSFFLPLRMQESMYEGLEGFVALEVMTEGRADARSDVYSLAKFVDYLYASSGLPFELRKVIEKATAENPDERYPSVESLYHAMKQRRSFRQTAVLGIGAFVIALLGLFLYLDLMPSTDPVEFVKPVDEPIDDDLLDDGFNPLTELGPDADSATIAKALQDYLTNDSGKIDEKKIREFEAKAEQIFRKQYIRAADQILSRIYNNDRMNKDEKNFMAASEEVMKELVSKQVELSKNSALSPEKAQRIASEIIEQLSEKKKAALGTNYGFQKDDGSNREESKTDNKQE